MSKEEKQLRHNVYEEVGKILGRELTHSERSFLSEAFQQMVAEKTKNQKETAQRYEKIIADLKAKLGIKKKAEPAKNVVVSNPFKGLRY